MTLDYFYSPPENIGTDSVRIDGDEFAHMTHVMRKTEGDVIRVVDGKGNAYDVQLLILNKRVAEGKILATYQFHNESDKHVAVAVGVLKNPSRFDFLVEKITELGIQEIIPLSTERTIPSHAKTERWQKLALSAMKQSCRSYLPNVQEMISIGDLVKSSDTYKRKIIFHEKAELPFQFIHSSDASTLIVIGPEGGFSDEEVELCCKAGFDCYSLGERRLRTETAAIVAASLVMLGG